MTMLMRTLLFPVDNGMVEGLPGSGMAAEYDIWTGKVVWRQGAKKPSSSRRGLLKSLQMVGIVCSPMVVAAVFSWLSYLGPFRQDQSDQMITYAPVLLGLSLFLAVEALMLELRTLRPLMDQEPPTDIQHQYFKGMFDATIRQNLSQKGRLPYLRAYLAAGLAILCIPCSYYVYLHTNAFIQSDLGALAILIVTSFFVALLPSLLWNLVVKHLFYLKLIRRTSSSEEADQL